MNLVEAINADDVDEAEKLILASDDVNADLGGGKTALDLAKTGRMRAMLSKYGAKTSAELQEEARVKKLKEKIELERAKKATNAKTKKPGNK